MLISDHVLCGQVIPIPSRAAINRRFLEFWNLVELGSLGIIYITACWHSLTEPLASPVPQNFTDRIFLVVRQNVSILPCITQSCQLKASLSSTVEKNWSDSRYFPSLPDVGTSNRCKNPRLKAPSPCTRGMNQSFSHEKKWMMMTTTMMILALVVVAVVDVWNKCSICLTIVSSSLEEF